MANAKSLPEKIIVTPYQQEFGPFEELCLAKQRQDALNEMICAVIANTDAPPTADFAESFYFLCQTQSQIMAGIVNGLSGWAEERRRAVQAEEAEASETSRAIKRLRETFIGEAAKAGVETSAVAAALNMRRSSIESVIARLHGDKPSPQTASATA